MEEIGLVLLEFLIELLFELAVLLPWDGLLAGRERRPGDPARIWHVTIGAMLIGSVLGYLSLLVFPSLLIRNEAARLVHLVASPLICGFLARALARRRTRRGQTSNPSLHFWFAFAFIIVFLAVRYGWAERPLGIEYTPKTALRAAPHTRYV